MISISIAQISIWIWSNALYKFQMAQLNEVELKVLSPWTQSIYDLEAAQHHSQMDSTGSQFWGGRKRECPEKTLEVRLRSTETQSTYNICSRGGRHDWCPLRQPGFPGGMHLGGYSYKNQTYSIRKLLVFRRSGNISFSLSQSHDKNVFFISSIHHTMTSIEVWLCSLPGPSI